MSTNHDCVFHLVVCQTKEERTHKFSSHRVFPTNSHMKVVNCLPILFAAKEQNIKQTITNDSHKLSQRLHKAPSDFLLTNQTKTTAEPNSFLSLQQLIISFTVT